MRDSSRSGRGMQPGRRTKGGGTGSGRTDGGDRSKHPSGMARPRKQESFRPPVVEPARGLAVALVDDVLSRGRAFDECWNARLSQAGDELAPRDRAFARLLATTVLRRLGSLEAVLARFLSRPLPREAGHAMAVLLTGAAQLLFLDTPAYAAVDAAVKLTRSARRSQRYEGLVNAVLRRVGEHGPASLAGLDTIALDVPDWLMARWSRRYGEATARAIAATSLQEAALDLAVKGDAAIWAARLDGMVLATGGIRRPAGGRVEALAGFAEGAWWVQDAAAQLPVRLLGDVSGLHVADLCAAPGGKTAQLAAAGALVTAVDFAPERIARLVENMARLRLDVQPVVADAAAWQPGRTFDVVLLDAPCTATGTIRRHPDILRLKRPEDVAKLAAVQARLLVNAATLVRHGGRLVYCTCSLEPEEGELQVEAMLATFGEFERVRVSPHGSDKPALATIPADWMSEAGEVRTLPHFTPAGGEPMPGMDGFYIAMLKRRS